MNNLFAKQPIYNLNNEIYGYELLYRNSDKNCYTGLVGETATASVIANAFMSNFDDNDLRGRKAFINYTSALIKSGTPFLLSPNECVIEVLESVVDSPDVLYSVEELALRGYVIALDDFIDIPENMRLFEVCSLVKLDFRQSNRDELLKLACKCREANKIMLAEKVETEEDYIFAKSIGCTYFQGYYFAKPQVISCRIGRPMAHILVSLFAVLFSDNPDLNVVIDLIKQDAVLQLRLLNIASSIGYGDNQVSSIDIAVSVLGTKRLRDWIFLVGLHCFGDAASDHLIQLSTLRAKFCEYIATASPVYLGDVGSAYLTGSLSLILKHDIEIARQNAETHLLCLSDDISEALLYQKGVLAKIVDLAICFETQEIEKAEQIAQEVQVSMEILAKAYEDIATNTECNLTHYLKCNFCR